MLPLKQLGTETGGQSWGEGDTAFQVLSWVTWFSHQAPPLTAAWLWGPPVSAPFRDTQLNTNDLKRGSFWLSLWRFQSGVFSLAPKQGSVVQESC